jgi:hypothetical protein
MVMQGMSGLFLASETDREPLPIVASNTSRTENRLAKKRTKNGSKCRKTANFPDFSGLLNKMFNPDLGRRNQLDE